MAGGNLGLKWRGSACTMTGPDRVRAGDGFSMTVAWHREKCGCGVRARRWYNHDGQHLTNAIGYPGSARGRSGSKCHAAVEFCAETHMRVLVFVGDPFTADPRVDAEASSLMKVRHEVGVVAGRTGVPMI